MGGGRAWRRAFALISLALFAPMARVSGEGEAGSEKTFFYVKPEAKRCFVINQNARTSFHVHYNFPGGGAAGAQMTLELKREEPGQGKEKTEPPVGHEFELEDEEGTLKFDIEKRGLHTLCASTSTKTEQGERGLRLSLSFHSGPKDDTFNKVINKMIEGESFDHLESELLDLRMMALRMIKEADYARESERDYHKKVLRLNREVIWWPIAQVVILLVAGFYQVRHLKQFFKKKRLV